MGLLRQPIVGLSLPAVCCTSSSGDRCCEGFGQLSTAGSPRIAAFCASATLLVRAHPVEVSILATALTGEWWLECLLKLASAASSSGRAGVGSAMRLLGPTSRFGPSFVCFELPSEGILTSALVWRELVSQRRQRWGEGLVGQLAKLCRLENELLA